MRPLIPFLAIALLLMASCRNSAPQSSDNRVATLTYGQGGGVTGKYSEYALTIEGNLYKHDMASGERVFVKKVERKPCRSLFIEAEKLNLMEMDFNHPANMNYYIIYRKGVNEKKVNWGDANKLPPAGVKELWEKLWELAR